MSESDSPQPIDIVTRLNQTRAEIERLRAQPCPYVTGTVTRYCTLTPFTLTDDERLAIQWVVGEALYADGVSVQATLRGLLERTRNWSPDGCETGQ